MSTTGKRKDFSAHFRLNKKHTKQMKTPLSYVSQGPSMQPCVLVGKHSFKISIIEDCFNTKSTSLRYIHFLPNHLISMADREWLSSNNKIRHRKLMAIHKRQRERRNHKILKEH
jgi:hypothetical protein